MSYQNYAGAWLTQTNGAYEWLPNEHAPVTPMSGVDTAKIWQSFTLPAGSPMNNLIVFGDHNYAAGNDADNVLIAEAPHDMLYGGRGQDVLVGSGGSATTFIVGAGEGNKVIQNFVEGADTLRLFGGPLTSFAAVKSAMTQQGSDVLLNDGGTMILFRGATVGQFKAADFELPLDRSTLGTPTFNEEFDNSGTIGTNWATNYGYAGDGLNSFTLPKNGEQQLYVSPAFKGTSGSPLGLNPYIFNAGVLSLTAKPVSDATAAQMWGYHYASGMIESNFSQAYGYFEMRAELPKGQGLWPAFWLLGEQNREIDVLEGLGSDTKTAFNAVHSDAVPALGNHSFNPYADGFHTYGVMWKPDTITYYVDSTPVWSTPTPSDMTGPMKMIVNLAVGGYWAGSPDGSTPFPAELKVDYVRVYNLPSVAPAPPPPAPPPPPPPPPGGGVVINSPGPGSTLVGGTGDDTLNASQGADRMTGGAGADVFGFKAMPWSSGHITDFQVGVDKLAISSLYAGGYSGADPVADGYLSFASDGAGGTRVYLDTDGRGAGNTIKFLVTTLDGVAPGGLTAANVLGGGGAPPPAPPPPPPPPPGGGVVINSPGPGSTLVGGTGDDTLNASQGADRMTGGAGADVFGFKAMPWSSGHITDFQVGVDKLAISSLYAGGYSGADPVADGYLSFASDGAGGTRVYLDTDGRGAGNTIKFLVTTLDGVAPGGLTAANVLGGGGAPPPVPPPPAPGGVVINSPGPGSTLVGGTGNDTLIASQGADKLTGAAGADHFQFDKLVWNPGHVTDFTPGSDVIDLRGLFAAAGYHGTDPIADGYLQFVSDGAGGTKVLFDEDGGGSAHPWPTTITVLDHVAPDAIHASDWLFH